MAEAKVKIRRRRAWTTTVFVKQIMALSGLVFIFFLLFHSWGNLKMFLGQEAYDHYAEWLKHDALVPIVPHGVFIWIFRGAMVLFLVMHVWAAALTWKKSRRARRSRYAVKKSVANAYAARTMRTTGIVLLIGIIFHILHFTTGTVKTGFVQADPPYVRMVHSFNDPLVLIFYAIFLICACIHVAHGFWSAFQSLGWARSATRRPMQYLSAAIAALIFIMFAAPPIAIALGIITL